MTWGSAAHYRLVGRALAGALAVAVLCRRPVRRVAVSGDSMEPTLRAGDRLLVVAGWPVRPGHLVTLRDPRRPARTMVKRVEARSDGWVTVVGDNPPASTDSRTFGPVARASIGGRVVYRYFPEGRRGRL